MARMRTIKPEIRRSLTVSSWPYPIRWTFVGLPGYLDDAGRGHDNTALIKAELYPLDADMTERKLEQHLITIATNGPLCRYEVAGQRYLHVISWAEHQRINRPSPSRIPPCPIHEASVSPSVNGSVSHSVSGSVSDSRPRVRPPAQARVPAEQGAGSREQGSREQGSREQGNEGAGIREAAAAASSGGITKQILDEHQAELGHLPAATIRGLEQHITTCLAEGATTEHVTAGLAEWRRRPHSKPGLLPHLVADAARVDPDPTHMTPEVRAWVEREQAKQAERAKAVGA